MIFSYVLSIADWQKSGVDNYWQKNSPELPFGRRAEVGKTTDHGWRATGGSMTPPCAQMASSLIAKKLARIPAAQVPASEW
jgi:hypothetical protein